jgi:peptidoglycan L-alanyl-D-glutamate endopeptidase CwlK
VSTEKKNQRVVGRAYVEARRESLRGGLCSLYLPFYDALCDRIDALGGEYWAPTDGIRSIAKQQELYDQGRTKPGKIVTNARPGFSAHNWGCATDWCEMRPEFKGQEMWDKANWNLYSQAVRDVKLTWGGSFVTFVDKPHNELSIRVTWRKVGEVYDQLGYDEALKYIEQNLMWRAP